MVFTASADVARGGALDDTARDDADHRITL
jgi:hypothetical protein